MIIDKLAITSAVVGSYYGFLSKKFDQDFKRSIYDGKDDNYEWVEDLNARNYLNIAKLKQESWYKESKVNKVEIRSYDGLKLFGSLIENNDTNNYVIVVHGRHGSIKSCFDMAYNFDKLGYNSLIYSQRACFDSEGTYVTYGQKESLDLIQWINLLIKRKPNVNICLHGTSLGAASVCMALGTKLPSNVKCAIEDCGFHSLKGLFKDHIKDKYKGLTDSFLVTYEALIKQKLGFGFNDVKPMSALKNNEIPICFVHGKNDDVVPYKSALVLYNANKGPKKFYSLNCGHAVCNAEPNYYNVLNDFMKEYLK